MGNLNPCPKKQKVDFLPEKWERGIGQVCLSCRSKLVLSETISLCRCYLFCHEDCFLKQYSPYIRQNQETRCVRCEQLIEFSYTYTVKWICIKKPAFLISVALAIVGWIAMLALTIAGIYRSIMPDAASYTLLVVVLIAFLLAMRYSLRRKYVELENVKCKNTKMGSTASVSVQSQQHIKDMEDSDIQKKPKKMKILSKQNAFQI